MQKTACHLTVTETQQNMWVKIHVKTSIIPYHQQESIKSSTNSTNIPTRDTWLFLKKVLDLESEDWDVGPRFVTEQWNDLH